MKTFRQTNWHLLTLRSWKNFTSIFHIAAQNHSSVFKCKSVESLNARYADQLEIKRDVAKLLFPVMGPDNHYLPFSTVYRTKTVDSTPSKHTSWAKKERKNPYPGKFSPSEQHVRNVDIMLQCESCEKWWLMFAKKMLQSKVKKKIEDI